MIVGIVSDVHGNTPGLATALARMGDVDVLLCAGDMVEEFRFSNEAVAMLREHEAVCVLGNHDLGLLGPHGARARSADHVDARHIAWLAGLPTSVTIDVDGRRLVMAHATPVGTGMPYLFPHSPELARLREVDADWIVLGHTHRQMAERVGRALVINPGSVGQARDPNNGKRFSYAVLDTGSGHVRFDDYTGDDVAAHAREGLSTR